MDRSRLGKCYELAGRKIQSVGGDGARLIHGSIQGFDNPRIGHAWVELEDGDVWEPASDEIWDRQVWEAMFNPEEHAGYHLLDACRMMLRHRHWGPWHKGTEVYGLDDSVSEFVRLVERTIRVYHGTDEDFDVPRPFTMFSTRRDYADQIGSRTLTFDIEVHNPADLRAMNLSPSDPNFRKWAKELQEQGYDSAHYRGEAWILFDPAKATRVLTERTTMQKYGGRYWTPAAGRGLVTVLVDLEKFDEQWKKSTGLYIGPGGEGGIKGRYERFGKWLEDNPDEPVIMPSVGVWNTSTVPGFTNGRHRTAWMRDHGARVIPMSVDREAVPTFRKLFQAITPGPAPSVTESEWREVAQAYEKHMEEGGDDVADMLFLVDADGDIHMKRGHSHEHAFGGMNRSRQFAFAYLPEWKIVTVDERLPRKQLDLALGEVRARLGVEPVAVWNGWFDGGPWMDARGLGESVAYFASLLEGFGDLTPEQERLQQVEKDLETEFPQLQDLHLSLDPGRQIFVHSIRMKEGQRGQGVGSEIIRRLQKLATKWQVPIVLSPEPEPRKKAALDRFYKSHGFKDNSGRRKDYSIGGMFGRHMVWRPPVKESVLDKVRWAPKGKEPEFSRVHGEGWGFWLARNGEILWCKDYTGRTRHSHAETCRHILEELGEDTTLMNLMNCESKVKEMGFLWGAVDPVWGIMVCTARDQKMNIPQQRTAKELGLMYGTPVHLNGRRIFESNIRESDAVAKPDDLKDLMREVSLGKDEDGYYVYTHRCRSDSYPTPHKIPKSKIEFVASTG